MVLANLFRKKGKSTSDEDVAQEEVPPEGSNFDRVPSSNMHEGMYADGVMSSNWARNQTEIQGEAGAVAHEEIRARRVLDDEGDWVVTPADTNSDSSQPLEAKDGEVPPWQDSDEEAELDRQMMKNEASRAGYCLRGSQQLEKIHHPATIQDKYIFKETIKQSSAGDRWVYLCEVTEAEAQRRGKPSLKSVGREFSKPSNESKGKESAPEEEPTVRTLCIVKVWSKGSLPKAEMDAWLKVQMTLLRMRHHPNLLLPRRILEDGMAYYVETDAVEIGCSLLQMLLNDASFSTKQVKRISRGVLRGLRQLHDAGLSHRDVKPDNVMLEWEDATHLLAKRARLPVGWFTDKNGPKGWVQPTQFKNAWRRHELRYIAKIIDFDTVSPNDATTICGTPGWMAPEAYVGNAGPQGDLFGVGLITYVSVACISPCHHAVHRALKGERFSEASASKRESVAAAARRALEKNVVFRANPWKEIPAIREFCKALLSDPPALRGKDARDVLQNATWFAADTEHELPEVRSFCE